DTDTDADVLPDDAITLDVTSSSEWVYVDLDEAGVVDESAGWDIKIQRYVVSFRDTVTVATVEDMAYEDLSTAPSDGYVAEFDGAAELPWYDYDMSTHVLTPKAQVFVLDTDVGYAKFEVLNYYHPDTGVSGHMSVRHASVAMP
ncbi:MAG: HmuY family protein, partial [Myxococcota bacterium]|nr:HmuY family protein [Myxococcota bacterium]